MIVEGQIWMTALLVPEAMVTSSNLPLATPISLYWTLPRCTRSRLLAGARVPGTLEGVSATSLTDKRTRPPPVGNVNTSSPTERTSHSSVASFMSRALTYSPKIRAAKLRNLALKTPFNETKGKSVGPLGTGENLDVRAGSG